MPPRVPFEPDDDAVALYHFDDQEPGVAVDQTGAGLHMHWHGADVSEDSPFDDVLPGEQGQAVCAQDFCWPGSLQIHAGIDTSGSIDDPSSLDTAPSFTVEAFLQGSRSPRKQWSSLAASLVRPSGCCAMTPRLERPQ